MSLFCCLSSCGSRGGDDCETDCEEPANGGDGDVCMGADVGGVRVVGSGSRR